MENQSTKPHNNHSLGKSGFREFPKTTALIWIVVLVVYSSLIVALNLATFLTFLLNRHLRIRSLYCLINQSLADASFTGGSCGLFCFFYAGVKIFDFDSDKQALQGTHIFSVFTFVSSLLSLDIVALERVYSIFLPFRHRTTKTKTYIVVFASTWSLSLLVALLRVYTHYFLVSYWTILTISPFIILLSYLAIFIKVKTRNGLRQNQQHSSLQRQQKRERELAVTLFVMSILSLFTCLPQNIFRIIYFKNSYHELYDEVPGGMSLIEIILYTNSLVNPIVYLFRLRNFRQAFFKLVFKCSRQGPSSIHHIAIITYEDNLYQQ